MEKIKQEIVVLIREANNDDWLSAKIEIEFPPFINKGITTRFLNKDQDGKYIRLIRFTEKLQDMIFDFIVKYNHDEKYNQITFESPSRNLEESTIEVMFNQTLHDTFLSNIPKSKRQKIVPWYKL